MLFCSIVQSTSDLFRPVLPSDLLTIIEDELHRQSLYSCIVFVAILTAIRFIRTFESVSYRHSFIKILVSHPSHRLWTSKTHDMCKNTFRSQLEPLFIGIFYAFVCIMSTPENYVTGSRLDSTINTFRKPQSGCGLKSVSLPDVDLSHLIIGPEAMDFRLRQIMVRDLDEFRVTSLSETNTSAKSKNDNPVKCLGLGVLKTAQKAPLVS